MLFIRRGCVLFVLILLQTLKQGVYADTAKDQLLRNLQVKENVRKGTEVGNAFVGFTAIAYTHRDNPLTDWKTHPIPYSNKFRVDRHGVIWTTGDKLDREEQDFYSFMVIPHNKHGKPEVLVRIKIIDVNDNYPVWQKTERDISIPEDAKKTGSRNTPRYYVGYATDKDSDH